MENKDKAFENIEITFEPEGTQKICSLCSPYFKIQGLSRGKIMEIIELESPEKISMKELNDFLYPETDELTRIANKKAIKTIVSPDVNGWNYIIWSLGWFEDCRALVQKISKYTKLKVSSFHIDPWSAYNYWIIAENGQIIREFEEDGGEILTNVGEPVCVSEDRFIKRLIKKQEKTVSIDEWASNRENPFIAAQEIYVEMIKATGQHLEILNESDSDKKVFVSGTINLEK